MTAGRLLVSASATLRNWFDTNPPPPVRAQRSSSAPKTSSPKCRNRGWRGWARHGRSREWGGFKLGAPINSKSALHRYQKRCSFTLPCNVRFAPKSGHSQRPG
jgi:hypothetical protein